MDRFCYTVFVDLTGFLIGKVDQDRKVFFEEKAFLIGKVNAHAVIVDTVVTITRVHINKLFHDDRIALNIEDLIVRQRKITGMSAILLPFHPDGSIDWASFDAHVVRTRDAGLVPAVNMDTGYANLIDDESRAAVLKRTKDAMQGSPFVAGAYVADQPGDEFNFQAYQKQIAQIHEFDGTPIIFQSYGLAHQPDDQIVSNYQAIGGECERFYAFELGTMFAPFGKIYSLDVYRELMLIDSCAGAKHSSLRRDLEWQRLQLQNEIAPDFMVLTGNDLAIDMVMYGSDYLLGLSTFCPEVFAKRDALWAAGDSEFFQLNDVLQYLGFFAFRNPTSGYKHDAAMFLRGRGMLESDLTHPKSVHRPSSDYAVLYEIGKQLGLNMTPPANKDS